jgi:hypothetical protein
MRLAQCLGAFCGAGAIAVAFFLWSPTSLSKFFALSFRSGVSTSVIGEHFALLSLADISIAVPDVGFKADAT